ncbi:unnamed protein product, partial [Allacma fusca]
MLSGVSEVAGDESSCSSRAPRGGESGQTSSSFSMLSVGLSSIEDVKVSHEPGPFVSTEAPVVT